MAYTSDTRIKNILKEIDIQARQELASLGFDLNLNLRVFDESNEDEKLWEDGGLSFKDPVTGRNLGSNDAGWSIDNQPLVIVEGTFGTERGQFGDGQLNRISHSLGVALNGYLGVTFVPFKGQSFVKKGAKKGLKSKNINYSNGLLHKGMVTVALQISKNNTGKFLIIDPYEPGALKDLLLHAVLNFYNKKNNLEEIILNHIKVLEDYLGKSVYGARSLQVITNLYDEHGEPIPCKARFYTQNIAALTTSSKRDGHGLLGKNLIELHSTSTDLYSIFIRLNFKDISLLSARKSKEFQFLANNPKIKVICFDDLVFTNKTLQKKLLDLKDQNLHQSSDKGLIKEIQSAFNAGEIRVKL